MIDSLYVHIPFCSNICGYCDFPKCRYSKTLADKYLAVLKSEIDNIKQDSFETIYIGGGTPSSLNIDQLNLLLTYLSRFKVLSEYCIEINPENFDLQKAYLFKHFGINRVSIGVQSFNEKLLEKMGRIHKNQDVINALNYLDEVGIANRNIDLIYGFEKQNLTDIVNDLKIAVGLKITHISYYGLEIYPNTLFGMHGYKKVDEDLDFLMYTTIIDYLNEHSYQQYETSNFAISGFQSQHNCNYWLYKNYLGIGLGACSKIGNYRTANTNNFVKYLNGEVFQNTERLTNDDVIFEAIMMNLRLLKGIDIDDFNKRFDTDIVNKYHQAISTNLNKGLLELCNNHLRVSEKGKFVLNDILVDFMN